MSKPCAGFSTRMSKRGSVFKVFRDPKGEVVKPPVLTDGLPEVGSGGSRSRREGHPIKATALRVGKES